VIHFGDITKISGYDVPIVDCIIGGSPCQDLSVAGKRAGLDGERSGLFMEQIRITKEMRERDAKNRRSGESIRPRFLVWENVPGAFSSNKGQDFRIVLEEIAKVVNKDAVIPMPPKDKWNTSGAIMGDGWSIAWRVLDAQFWGVPQRRRRIALVADFGGGCAPEVLFERKSLRGDFEESRTERESASSDAEGCVGVHDREGQGFDGYNGCLTGNVSSTLGVNCGMATGRNGVITLEPGIASREGGHIYEGVSGTLRANAGDNQMSVAYCYDARGNGDGETCCMLTGDKTMTLTNCATDPHHIPCVVMDRSAYNQGVNAKFNIGIDENGVAFSHIAKGPGAVCYIDTTHADDVVRTDDVVAPLQARDYKGRKLIAMAEENPVICLQGNGIDRADTAGCNGKGWKEGTCYTLNTVDRPAVCYKKPHYIVRRLTPLECERLQGFKDGWTDIGEYTDSKGKKKNTSDSARYKALGNSIALPPWKWVLKRICSYYERDATMASLFDGIGGFPCLWEQLNGKGTALWASEIEDFPIAVTKARIE
jgi:DNA (cytosine-5)-methyltransferase 1